MNVPVTKIQIANKFIAPFAIKPSELPHFDLYSNFILPIHSVMPFEEYILSDIIS